jgi:2-dehydro-3-deoxyphosphogluconate aldolase/(4S)-4-hydroxy-2-oxoglutarate aldolase
VSRAHQQATEIERGRLLAIIRLEPASAAIAAARLLAENGIRAVEFSLATEGAPEALRSSAAELAATISIGAGTVRTVADAERAVEAGASYLVSPHLADEVSAWARERDVLHIPGAFSPTEVAAALEADAPLIKLFPAGRGGPSYIRDLLSPFPEARLVPTGGINLDNGRAFLDAGAAALAVGSALVGAGARDRASLARRYVELARETGGGVSRPQHPRPGMRA